MVDARQRVPPLDAVGCRAIRARASSISS